MFRKYNPKRLLNRLVAWRIAKVSEKNFLYMLSLVVGLLSGLAALILKRSIHFVAEGLTSYIDLEGFRYLYLFFPMFGIFLTVLFIRYFIKDDIGHGVSKILYAISKKSSKLKPHKMYSSMVASSLTIGFGGDKGFNANQIVAEINRLPVNKEVKAVILSELKSTQQ